MSQRLFCRLRMVAARTPLSDGFWHSRWKSSRIADGVRTNTSSLAASSVSATTLKRGFSDRGAGGVGLKIASRNSCSSISLSSEMSITVR